MPLKIQNFTDYPEFTFPAFSVDGLAYETCVVRAVFQILPNDDLIALEQQPGPQLLDSYYGDPRASSLRTEHDRVPAKPRGEVYFIDPIARNFSGTPAREWPVHVHIGGLEVSFRVTGPRRYRYRRILGWTITDPEPCQEVPVRYELAFGGTDPHQPAHHHGANPVGRGFVGSRRRDIDVDAPQIVPLASESEEQTLGITPVHRAWQPRRALVGTLDEAWFKSKWPLYPDDFDDGYFQQAPTALQLRSGYFGGNEAVDIRGLGKRARYQFRLPETRRLSLVCTGSAGECAYTELNLDTVTLNLESEQLALVWRASFIVPDWAIEAALLTDGASDG